MTAATQQLLHVAPGSAREAPRTGTDERASGLSAGGPTNPTSDKRKGQPRRTVDKPWRPSAVWREQARCLLDELRVQLDELPPDKQDTSRCRDARRQLEDATHIIDIRPRLRGMWNGVDVEATWARIHAIEVALVRLAEPRVVKAKLPSIVDDGAELLGRDDPRVAALRDCSSKPDWDEHARETIAHCVKAVYDAADSENVRLRSFRNLLLGATVALAVIGVVLAAVGMSSPSSLGLSTGMSHSGTPNIVVVELLGLVSASLVGALSISRMRGTSTAYSVPMATMLLKLPAGALTAVAGLLMIKAGIAGSALMASTDAHVMGYALLLGASQQGVTGLVDRQAQKVLNGVASKDNA